MRAFPTFQLSLTRIFLVSVIVTVFLLIATQTYSPGVAAIGIINRQHFIAPVAGEPQFVGFGRIQSSLDAEIFSPRSAWGGQTSGNAANFRQVSSPPSLSTSHSPPPSLLLSPTSLPPISLIPTLMPLPTPQFTPGLGSSVRDARVALRKRLGTEAARLRARFPPSALERARVTGIGLSAAVGERLTTAAVSGEEYVVGVTGGSSTAGRSSWPAMLQAWLRSPAIGIAGANVRNAAQGTTSQLVTAPCIFALVGGEVDLLLWEFAMNDEYEYVASDAGPAWPMRKRVAEAYVRQAAQLNPGAIGYVNLWDLDIHSYHSGPILPNKAFGPTAAVAAAYAPVYDRYFAIDVIGAMFHSGLYSEKSAFLRDAHHPNDFGYAAIVDLISLAMIEPWIEYLDTSAMGSPALKIDTSTAIVAANVRSHPMLTPSRDDLYMPGERTLAHCYMAMPPQFSDAASNALRAVHTGACTAVDVRDCDPTVNFGRSDANREDRQLRFTPAECAPDGNSGGMLFATSIRDLAAVLVDCGYSEGNYCLSAIDVFLDGHKIGPSHAPNDILSAFFKWAHKVNGSSLSESQTHSLRVCARGGEAHFSRLIVLEQK